MDLSPAPYGAVLSSPCDCKAMGNPCARTISPFRKRAHLFLLCRKRSALGPKMLHPEADCFSHEASCQDSCRADREATDYGGGIGQLLDMYKPERVMMCICVQKVERVTGFFPNTIDECPWVWCRCAQFLLSGRRPATACGMDGAFGIVLHHPTRSQPVARRLPSIADAAILAAICETTDFRCC